MNESQNSGIDTSVWSQGDDIDTAVGSAESNEKWVEKIVGLIQLYWKRRTMAVSIIGTGLILSVAYSLTVRNFYRSSTSLMPQDNSSPYSSMLSMLSGAGSSSTLGSEALGINSPGELLVGILESRTVHDSLITRFNLMRYYNAHVIEDARKALSSSTVVDEDRKSGIITITVTDKDPNFACKLADGYVTELDRVLTENSTSAARRERQFLEGRLHEVKQDLDNSSEAVSKFSTKKMAIDIPAQARSMVDAIGRLQSLLSEGESQLAALRESYSEDNYRVKSLEARNTELRRQLNALSGGSGQHSSAVGNDRSSYPGVDELPTLGLTYADLERKVRVDEALWETLTKQYEMARVQEAKEIPTIRVLDTANVPNRKAGPRRTAIVMLGGVLSFLLSFGVIFGQARWKEMDEDALPKRLLRGLTRNGT